MTRTTYQALKRYIMREREKKKQEQEQDKEQERLKKERELKKKKEQEDSLTLEQTKEQIFQLEEKLKVLKQEKHEMFQQLKKVLNQESEMKQRAQVKEQNEMAAWQQFHNPGIGSITGPSQSLFLQRHIKYMNVPVSGSQGVKRSRSPSPSPSAPYQHYGAQLQMPAGQYNPSTIKAEPYSSAASEYGGKMVKTEPSPYQPGHGYQQQQLAQQMPSYQTASQSPAGKYPAVGPSAFSSYASHYPPHQQKPSVPEQYQTVSNYPRQPIQRRQQQTVSSYVTTSNLPIQQQLEHANQKSGFPDDKMKLQQAMMVAQGQPPPPSQKGSIMSGYPVVAPPQQQVPSSAYNPAANPGSLAPPRHGYGQSRQY